MAYNWPRGTNVEIKWDTAVELVKIKNVVAIKDSTANRLQMIETVEHVGDKVRIFALVCQPARPRRDSRHRRRRQHRRRPHGGAVRIGLL